MLSVEQKGAETVLISLKSEELQLHSPQAPQISHVVRVFLTELTKVLIPHPCFFYDRDLRELYDPSTQCINATTTENMRRIPSDVVQCNSNVAHDWGKFFKGPVSLMPVKIMLHLSLFRVQSMLLP